MIDESLWINPFHGLELKPGFDPSKRGNENGILFLCEYYFLKFKLGKLDAGDIAIFETITKRLQTYDLKQNQIKGLYDRGAGESITIPPEKRRTISRDNLLAIAAFSYKFDLPFNTDIYNHGMKNFWRFDNCYPENPRWARFLWNVIDIIYLMRVSKKPVGTILGFLMMWLFYAAQFHTILTKYAIRPAWYTRFLNKITGKKSQEVRKIIDTSGPWLVFVKMFPLLKKSIFARVFFWMFTKIVRFQHPKGWKTIGDIYFGHVEHPNRLLMAECVKQGKM
jgi:hypothetical protein